MSQENVKLTNRAWDAWFRGDPGALAETWDPEIVWDVSHFRDWPEHAYVGIENSRRFAAEWLGLWDDYEVGVDETLAAPDGRVVSLFWQRGKGRRSGLEVRFDAAMIFTFRDGKMIRTDIYDSRAVALEAVGLLE
jgi:ketosteroid isomerase-like protein